MSADAVTQSLETSAGEDATNINQTQRGITGVYSFRYDGPALRVRTQRDADAPLIVRLRRVDDQDYEAKFIGTREGEFDLAETLEHANGSSAVLPTMPVRIISTLPNDQRSDLFQAIEFQPSLAGGYRLWLVMAIVLWLMLPVTIYAIRYWRRPAPVEEVPPPAKPTWAEQLEPVVTAALKRPLTTEEQRHLELLLLHYWRERSGVEADDMAESIRKLRYHPEAGTVVCAIEQWLHRRASRSPHDSNGEEIAHGQPEIIKILEPFLSQLLASKPASMGGAT